MRITHVNDKEEDQDESEEQEQEQVRVGARRIAFQYLPVISSEVDFLESIRLLGSHKSFISNWHCSSSSSSWDDAEENAAFHSLRSG